MSGLRPLGEQANGLLDNMEDQDVVSRGSDHGTDTGGWPSYKTRADPADASSLAHGDGQHNHHIDEDGVAPQAYPYHHHHRHPSSDRRGHSPDRGTSSPDSAGTSLGELERFVRQTRGDTGSTPGDLRPPRSASPGACAGPRDHGGHSGAGGAGESPVLGGGSRVAGDQGLRAELGGVLGPVREDSAPEPSSFPPPESPPPPPPRFSEAAASPESQEKSPPLFSAPREHPPPPSPRPQSPLLPPAALYDSDSSTTAVDTAPLIPSPKKRPSASTTNTTSPATPGRGGYGAMEKNGDGGWSPYTSKTDMVPEKTSSGGHPEAKGSGGNGTFVYVLACFATIGGLLFGYDTGIVSGSMLLIKPYFDLSTVWHEIIVSGTIGAAALFALIAGVFCDWLGRKKTIMVASFVFTVGAVVMAAANNKEVLLGGRMIVGIGIGFASMTVPVYVAEAAPPSIRGRLVTLNQLFITIGILLSSVIAGAFSSMKDTGWRYMLGIAGAPGLLQFIGFFFLPESPRWLVSKGRDEEAKEVLRRIRGYNDIEEEYQEVKDAETNKQTGFVLGQILKTPHVRKAMFIGCGLQLFQQLCGINTVIYYSASILKMAGFPPEQAIWLVCVPFGVNFLATFIGVWAVERLGRKLLLLLSFVGVTIALIVLAVGFYLSVENSPAVNATMPVFLGNGSLSHDECQGYSICEDCILNDKCGYCNDESQSGAATCLLAYDDDKDVYSDYGRCSKNSSSLPGQDIHWSYGYCPTDYTWMAVLGLALFVFSFAPGLGPMPWTINSEIYPMWARGTANSIATTTNWVFNLLVSLTFLTLLETITKYGTFFLFTGICILGFVFTAVFVPETRNKSLEEVEEVFMDPQLREQHKRERLAAKDVTVEDPTDVSGIDTRF